MATTSSVTKAACPRCGFDRDALARDCPRCGIVFAKWDDLATTPPPATAVVETADEVDATHGSPPSGREWRMLGIALAAAALANALPIVSFVLSVLATLFHEFGHAAASWLLGHPAVPAFDIVYGGGFTHEDDFQLPIALIVGALWAWLGWSFRRNPRTLAVLGPGAALWLYAVTSPVRREIVIASMGHLGELILAATFVFMALAAVGWRRPDLERPLGAFLGFFVAIHTMLFARRLIRDPDFLAWYREGKGGALMNDLESIVLDLHIWTGKALTIEDAARALLVVAVVALGAALALGALRHRLRQLASSLLEIR